MPHHSSNSKMQLKGSFGQQIAEALLFFYTITSKSIKNELYGTYRPVGDTSLHKMNTYFTCSKRGIVATLENALSIRNNISRRNYTRASSQSAAQYFRIVRSSWYDFRVVVVRMEAFGAEALGIQSLAVWAVLYICGTPFHQ